MIKDNKKIVALSVDKELLKLIDYVAQNQKVTKSELLIYCFLTIYKEALDKQRKEN